MEKIHSETINTSGFTSFEYINAKDKFASVWESSQDPYNTVACQYHLQELEIHQRLHDSESW